MKTIDVFLNVDEAIQGMGDKMVYNLSSLENYRNGGGNWSVEIYSLDKNVKLVRETVVRSWPSLVRSGENPEYETHIKQFVDYYVFDNDKPVLESAAIKEKVREITGENLPSLRLDVEPKFFESSSTIYNFVSEVKPEKNFPKICANDYQPSNAELKKQSLEAEKAIDSMAAYFGFKDKEKFAEMLPELRKNASKMSKKISLT